MTKKISARQKSFFTENLLMWHHNKNKRPMPWKNEKDPYKVWLSEVILQQTRVEQGLSYYLNFIKHYPNVEKLAAASEQKIMKLWEGLGYYSRARNLHATAKYISNECKGEFPNNYKDLLSLKGVGPYTAAAISSFCYNEAVAVLDGNVIRVLSRFFGVKMAFNASQGKKMFEYLAKEVLYKKKPAEYNQAIMDFGATVCKPKLALCSHCPLQSECYANKHDKVAVLPVKKKKVILKKRYFFSFIIQHNGHYVIEQRTGNDIWKQLFQTPTVEVHNFDKNSAKQAKQVFDSQFNKTDYKIGEISEVYKQKLSHQHVHMVFVNINLKEVLSLDGEKYRYTRNLANFAFPKIFILYFQSKNLILENNNLKK